MIPAVVVCAVWAGHQQIGRDERHMRQHHREQRRAVRYLCATARKRSHFSVRGGKYVVDVGLICMPCAGSACRFALLLCLSSISLSLSLSPPVSLASSCLTMVCRVFNLE